MGEFLQAKFQPCFYGSQRSMCRGGNFPVTESLEESELERLALEPRQHSHALLEKKTQIIQHKNIVCLARRVWHLLDHALLITLAYARISLTATQTINGTTTRNRNHPSQRLTRFR